MGLHRDGAQWNLPADVVDDRRFVWMVPLTHTRRLMYSDRRLFWETYTADVFQVKGYASNISFQLLLNNPLVPIQANCFSRPLVAGCIRFEFECSH